MEKIILQLSSNTHFICSTEGKLNNLNMNNPNTTKRRAHREDSDQPAHLCNLINLLGAFLVAKDQRIFHEDGQFFYKTM